MTKYAIMWICETCEEPTRTLNISQYFGEKIAYDSGHMWNSIEDVVEIFNEFIETVSSIPFMNRTNGFWLDYPFDNTDEEVEYLLNHLGIFKLNITNETM